MIQGQIFPPQSYRRQPYLISTASDKINVDCVHRFLADESYWVPGITKPAVERLLKFALCYGVYDCSDGDEVQIGFARVITDYASFAYLADLFILSNYRGRGLGKWLISCILAHPELQSLRKWMLNTKDAQGLYQQFGFTLHAERDTYMVYRPQDRDETLIDRVME